MSDQACGESFQDLKAGIEKAGSPADARLASLKLSPASTMVLQ